ncbi:MAG: toll/interleukin-1 receptor domain-containing protein [Planctomycetia bacterium]|nr:toll/interleukin-1 receptor domain-containing protein [Planctomycetia bacterium]
MKQEAQHGKGPHKRAAAAKSEYRVFVSHATADKWLATMICEKIEAPEVGATAFRDDRDIHGGEDIPTGLKAAIESSDEMIVLLTPASITRQWVIAEIGMAWMTNLRIVPVWHYVEPTQIPEIIRSNRGYSLNDISQYLEALAQRVNLK